MSEGGTPGRQPPTRPSDTPASHVNEGRYPSAPTPAGAYTPARTEDSCLLIFLVWGTFLMPIYMVYKNWALKRTPGTGGDQQGSAALLALWTTLTLGLFGLIWSAFHNRIDEPPTLRRFWHAIGATWLTLATLGLYSLAWRKLPAAHRASISINGMFVLWVAIAIGLIAIF